VSILAFADDIILLAPSELAAQKLLDTTHKYLDNLGMKIAVTKSAAFKIQVTKNSWFIAKPNLEMDGEQIPNLDASDRIRYLGGWISPWDGLVLEGIEDHLHTVLERVEHLALKPHQKAQFISAHIVPYYLYPLILAVHPISTIRKLDQELRRSIKKIYHLPSCTANGLIYCKKKDGGAWLSES
jgi:hypothetical protein